MKRLYINLLIVSLILTSSMAIAADFPPWEVPADAAAKQNPLEANKKAIEDGASLYKLQCAACHGPAADGRGVIPAADLTSEAFVKQTDGAIFHKIFNGRATMPAFKALPENDLWSIVLFLRNLGDVANAAPKKNGELALKLRDENGTNAIIVKLLEVLEDGAKKPVADAKVGVYVKRYFGFLPVSDNTLYTDKDGDLKVTLPEGIPGDEEGKLSIVVKLEDSEFNAVEAEQEIAWGTVLPASNWDSYRALWRTNEFAPWWIILSYLGITIGIWIGIFYVMLLLKKIKNAA